MQNIRNKFNHNGEDLYLEFEKYANGMGTAMIIKDEMGQPYSVITINMPHVKLEQGEFIIKNYSENKEIADSIFKTGWFEDLGRRVRTGYVEVPVWRFK